MPPRRRSQDCKRIVGIASAPVNRGGRRPRSPRQCGHRPSRALTGRAVSFSNHSRVGVAARVASPRYRGPCSLAPRSMVRSLHVLCTPKVRAPPPWRAAFASAGRTHRTRGQDNENRSKRNLSCCKHESQSCP
ncbi:hypothetical protein Bcep1808_4381 [Burkholderia vietnamiensis G4]|uniref:Uncharacterized protein n=1 Tax=Burkholderia vietnamiensis (strain G4 / LMG 22486) TaxID=269482 RepID=A4JM44_BURVG|nr:hypothetical protein Bcep1808_4381 [Burkholderia vietnamiensis G4]